MAHGNSIDGGVGDDKLDPENLDQDDIDQDDIGHLVSDGAIFDRIDRYLDTLPVSASTKLFAAVERHQRDDASPTQTLATPIDGPGAVEAVHLLPKEALLELLRRRLPKTAFYPPRSVSARRIFFEPFDAFFINAQIGRKRYARIPRSSLPLVWRFIQYEKFCPNATGAVEAFERECGTSKQDEYAQLLRRAVHTDLTAISRKAKGDVDVIRQAATFLANGKDISEGYQVFDDLMEINRMLPLSSALMDLKSVVPLEAASVSEAMSSDIRKLFFRVAGEHPEDAAYILMSTAGRLKYPWRAMPLYYQLAHEPAAGALADLLLSDFEELVRALQGFDLDENGAPDAIDLFKRCAAYAEGMLVEAETDRALVARIEAGRDLASTALTSMLARANDHVRRMMPEAGTFGAPALAPKRPDINADLQDDVFRRARNGAVFVGMANVIAEALKAPGAAVGADAMAAKVALFAENLVIEIKVSEGARRERALAFFEKLLEAQATLLDHEAVNDLKSRAKDAAFLA
ncbi:MAG: hypothetical protein AAGA22_00610 [Pseudomonadota bacterium]